MGFFNDLLIATEQDADDVARTSLPARKWPGVELKNINIIDLENLYDITISPERRSQRQSALDYFPEIQVTKKRVAIHRLPQEFTMALATATSANIAIWAQGWSEAPEFHGLWEPGDLQEVLEDISALAKLAIERNQSLLFRVAG